MLFQNLASICALVGVAAAIETHGNPPVDFEVRLLGAEEPLTTDIKDYYEKSAAAIAFERIENQVKATGVAEQCLTAGNPEDQRNAVYTLKDCIIEETQNERIFFDLLKDDITEADTFWREVVAESDSDMTAWIAARARVKAYFNGSLTAVQFAGWTLSPYADLANLHGNPEHYYKSTPSNATDTSSEILEGWGGVVSTVGTKRTHFKVPSYQQPKFDGTDYPTIWALGPQFYGPLQRAGLKQLVDGTTFGVLHIAVRDLAADETSAEGETGIEIYSAVWSPAYDKANEGEQEEFKKYLQDEAEHMVVEIVNLTLQAREDLST